MEPENGPWKKRFLLEIIMFSFHVKFRGLIYTAFIGLSLRHDTSSGLSHCISLTKGFKRYTLGGTKNYASNRLGFLLSNARSISCMPLLIYRVLKDTPPLNNPITDANDLTIKCFPYYWAQLEVMDSFP